MTTQIDFNTIINTLFTSALQPLQDEIQTLKEKIVKQDEFLAMWNFNDKDAFKKAVVDVVGNSVEVDDKLGEMVRNHTEEIIEEEVDKKVNSDLEEAIDKALNDKDWGDEIDAAVDKGSGWPRSGRQDSPVHRRQRFP